MKVYPSVSGKKIVEKSAMEPSIVWAGGVFQWGRVKEFDFKKEQLPATKYHNFDHVLSF